MSGTAKGPPESPVKGIAAELPLIKLPERMILFPPMHHIGVPLGKKEIALGYPALLRQERAYAILHVTAPDLPHHMRSLNKNLGLVGKITKVIEDEDGIKFNIIGIHRATFEPVPGKKGDIRMARWHPILDTPNPVPPHVIESPSFKHMLEAFKEMFTTFTEWLNTTTPNITQTPAFQNVSLRVKNLDATNIPQTVDGVFSILDNIGTVDDGGNDMLSIPLLLAFREADTGDRMHMAYQLMFMLTRDRGENPEATEKTEQKPHATQNDKEALISILFPDTTNEPETAENTQANNGILDIPDDMEASAITHISEFLAKRVIGQERPRRMITRAFNLAKAGNMPKRGPLLRVVFAGPKGVGKTEMALALVDWLWNAEKKALAQAKEKGTALPFTDKDIEKPPFVKVPCGDFAGDNAHGVADLIGAPVGYIGSKSDRKSYRPPIFNPKNFPPNRITVLLLDELEEAFIGARNEGAELMGVLMEAFEAGKYVNKAGEEVDLSLTIAISTTNIGSENIMQKAKAPTIGVRPRRDETKKRMTEDEIERLNDKIYETTKDAYQKTFRPQLRDRLGRLVVFRFLTDTEYGEIVKKAFSEEIAEWAKKKADIQVELSSEALGWIQDELKFEEGVRDVREFIRKEIGEPLARAYNLKRLNPGRTYIVRIKRVPLKSGKKKEDEDTEIKAYFTIL